MARPAGDLVSLDLLAKLGNALRSGSPSSRVQQEHTFISAYVYGRLARCYVGSRCGLPSWKERGRRGGGKRESRSRRKISPPTSVNMVPYTVVSELFAACIEPSSRRQGDRSRRWNASGEGDPVLRVADARRCVGFGSVWTSGLTNTHVLQCHAVGRKITMEMVGSSWPFSL